MRVDKRDQANSLGGAVESPPTGAASGGLIDPARVTTNQLAALFGVTAGAVSRWHSRDACPRNNDRTFDLSAVLQWFRGGKGQSVAGDGEKLDYRQEQARLYHERANIALLQRMKLAGDLVQAERVARDVGNLIALVRTKLLQLPGALAHRLASEDNPSSVMAILDDEIGNVLNELARARLEDLGGASDPSPLPVDGETDDDDNNTDGDGDAEPPETAKKARGRKKREVVQED